MAFTVATWNINSVRLREGIVRKLMQDPGFWAVARDCYAMRDVGDLEERPEQMQMAWVAALAEFWNRRHSEAPPLTALERGDAIFCGIDPGTRPWGRRRRMAAAPRPPGRARAATGGRSRPR